MNPEGVSWVNRVLDRAERMRGFPLVAGAAIGTGVSWGLAGWWWAWLILAAGVILSLIRPVGTSLRPWLMIRRARRMVAARRRTGTGQKP